MWKEVVYVLLVTGLVIFVALLLCGAGEGDVFFEAVYVVQPGDSLYSIAAELEISDWRRWAHRVCERNGLAGGGEIVAGSEIVVFVGER